MFGYITIHKPELKFKEYDIYHSYYCGLCHTLKDLFSNTSRLSLNYDLTFLAILLSSLYEPDTKENQTKCIIHPVQKHLSYRNECIDYAAKMTIVLSYFKCLDDWQDERKIGKKIYSQVLYHDYFQIKNEYPKKIEKIEKYLLIIQKKEQEQISSLDEIANYFGKIMAEICVYKDDEWKDELYELGFYLGKFIYIMDAYDDIEKDIKKGCFNPLIQKYQSNHFEQYSHDILEMMISRVATVLECLPLIENIEILRNIIYSGVWTKYELRKKQRMEDTK